MANLKLKERMTEREVNHIYNSLSELQGSVVELKVESAKHAEITKTIIEKVEGTHENVKSILEKLDKTQEGKIKLLTKLLLTGLGSGSAVVVILKLLGVQ